MQVIIQNRDYTNRTQFEYEINPVKWSANVIGGPKTAELEVKGSPMVLGQLATLLRCPVIIYDDNSSPVWWGFINSVEYDIGKHRAGVSLDNVYNNVAVAYSYVAVGSAEVGTRKTTAWSGDTTSQGIYGIKETLVSVSGASDAEAESRRDKFLADSKNPLQTISLGAGGQGARIYCRGWFDTLGWKYYANTGTTAVATTTQISAMVTADGQFITATYINDASGITSSEYRDGDKTALDEIVDLLASGVTAGRRLLASVDIGRRLTVYQEPLISSIPWGITQENQITYGGSNTAITEGTLPLGWMRMVDFPFLTGQTLSADPSKYYVDEAEYTAGYGLRLTTRNQAGPFEVFG
jgi:hypothetical protein